MSAVTGGRDALGEVTVMLELERGSWPPAQGVSTDILEASGKAYLRALSNALAKAEQDWDGSAAAEAERSSSASGARPHSLTMATSSGATESALVRFRRGALEEAVDLIAAGAACPTTRSSRRSARR